MCSEFYTKMSLEFSRLFFFKITNYVVLFVSPSGCAILSRLSSCFWDSLNFNLVYGTIFVLRVNRLKTCQLYIYMDKLILKKNISKFEQLGVNNHSKNKYSNRCFFFKFHWINIIFTVFKDIKNYEDTCTL